MYIESVGLNYFLLVCRTDVFRLLAGEKIGNINKIQIRTDGTGEKPSWFLDEVGLILKISFWNELCMYIH